VTSAVRYPVIELRQYTLRPGQRDVLIELFDRELVETQEAEGMAVVGQFRDLDDPDRFVWIRGFGDMPSRARALAAFYGGPAWKAHRAEANATMIDSDNVLLLRPVSAGTGFPEPAAARLPVGATAAGSSRILVTLHYRDQPFDQAFADFFDRQARPALIEAGATPLACLQTEHAENTFPALPVRAGENVFASVARFPSEARLDGYLRQAGSSGAAQQLRLAPTARSLLR
jgi:quinol monooxygenase YgiN